MTNYLQDAVAALLDPTRMRVYREDTKNHAWQTIPSIWQQLRTSSQWGSQEAGGSKFGSRPVISTGVVALTIDIRDTVGEAADEIGRRTRTPTNARDTPTELRAVAANLVDPDLIGWWTDKIRKWVAEARSTLRLDPPRPKSARGAKCPSCGQGTVETINDGETIRSPALAIQWAGPQDNDYHPDTEWKVRAVECRACATAWFRGDSMNELIDRMMEANRTQETMTDGVA